MPTEWTTRLLLLAIAMALGVFLTWQAPINAEASRRLASPPLAALLSLTLSFSLVLLFALVTVRTLPDLSRIAAAPWWVWIGGVAGAFFVIGSLLIVPKTGSVLFLLAVILGQMIGALTADGFGLWGLRETPISTMKLLAVGLVLAGAVTFNLAE